MAKPAISDLIAEGTGFTDQVDDFRWRDVAFEDWLSVALLWITGATVFTQFFTRYVMNDSYAWTEEIAIYLLMVLTFIGSAMCVRRNSHIHVEFCYQYLPPGVARAASTLVDLLRVAFFALVTWLGWRVTELMGFQNMVVIDVSLRWVYGACTFGCALMTLRAIQVTVQHWRQGWSALTRPDAASGVSM